MGLGGRTTPNFYSQERYPYPYKLVFSVFFGILLSPAWLPRLLSTLPLLFYALSCNELDNPTSFVYFEILINPILTHFSTLHFRFSIAPAWVPPRSLHRYMFSNTTTEPNLTYYSHICTLFSTLWKQVGTQTRNIIIVL